MLVVTNMTFEIACHIFSQSLAMLVNKTFHASTAFKNQERLTSTKEQLILVFSTLYTTNSPKFKIDAWSCDAQHCSFEKRTAGCSCIQPFFKQCGRGIELATSVQRKTDCCVSLAYRFCMFIDVLNCFKNKIHSVEKKISSSEMSLKSATLFDRI